MFRTAFIRGITASSRLTGRSIMTQATKSTMAASTRLSAFARSTVVSRPAAVFAAAAAVPVCATSLLVARPFTASSANYAKKDAKKKKGGKPKSANEMPPQYAQALEAIENDDFLGAVELLQETLDKIARLGPANPNVMKVTEQLGRLFYGGEEYEGAAYMLERRLFHHDFDEQEVKGVTENWKSMVDMDNEAEMALLLELSESYAHIGEHESALAIVEHLRDYFKEQNDVEEQVRCELTIGNIRYAQAEEDPAQRAQVMDYFEQVLARNTPLYQQDPEFASEVDFQFASIVELEEPDKAKAAYERALEAFNKLIVENEGMLEEYTKLMDSGDEKAAEELIASDSGAVDPSGDLLMLQERKYQTLMGLAACSSSEHASKKDFESAKGHLEAALKVARELEGPEANPMAAWSLHMLGKLYDDFEKSSIYAEGFFNAAVGEYEHRDLMLTMEEDGDYLEGYVDTLEDFISFYKKHGRRADAEAVAKKLAKAKEMMNEWEEADEE